MTDEDYEAQFCFPPKRNRLKNYTLSDLHASKDMDRHAVRDEAQRRHNLAAKRFVAAKNEMIALEALLKDLL